MTIFAVEYVYGAEAEEARTTHRPAHREWLTGKAEESILLASGPYADGAGALLIFKTQNEEALREILAQDPMSVGGGVTGLRISEWTPLIGEFKHHID